MKLAMNIAAYLQAKSVSAECPRRPTTVAYRYWSRDRDDIAFFDEEFAGLVAQLSDLRFGDRTAGAQLRDGSATKNQHMERQFIDSESCATRYLPVEVAHGDR